MSSGQKQSAILAATVSALVLAALFIREHQPVTVIRFPNRSALNIVNRFGRSDYSVMATLCCKDTLTFSVAGFPDDLSHSNARRKMLNHFPFPIAEFQNLRLHRISVGGVLCPREFLSLVHSIKFML